MTSQGSFNLKKQKKKKKKNLLESFFRELFNSLSMFYENQIEKRNIQILPTRAVLSGASH